MKRIGKKTVSSFFLLLLLLPCSVRSIERGKTNLNFSEVEKKWLQTHPVIRVANEFDWPPFDFNEYETPRGLAIDHIKLLANKIGVEIDFIYGYTWAELVELFKQKKIDVMPVFYRNRERESFTLYTTPYYKGKLGIFTCTDNKSWNGNLNNKTIGMEKSHGSIPIVKKQLPGIILIEVGSKVELVRKLATKQLDAIIGNPFVFYYLAKESQITNIQLSDFLRMSEKEQSNTSLHVGIREDWPVLHKIMQKAMQNVSEEEMNKIETKWADIRIVKRTDRKRIIQVSISIIIIILLVFAIVGMWYLKRIVRQKTQSLRKEIEERKLIERQFQHSHELMHYVISHARSAIAVHDRDLNYVYVSDRYLKEYDVKENNVIGKHHYDIFPDLPQKWRDVHQKALAGETSSAEEDPYCREDGSVEWTRWECRPWYGSDGTIGGIIIYTEVITKQIEDKLALQKSKQEWENTFDAISDLVTIQDKDMRILMANKSAHQFFQVSPGELNEKHCYEIFRGASSPCPNCPELNTIADLSSHSETIVHEKLNKVFNVTSSPILGKNGEIQNIIHIAKDITEHKKMEAELFQSHKMEAIGTLAGGIAHDFNNILAAILGYADMAKDDIPDWSPAKQPLNEVLKAGNRAKDLVKQILAFSRKSEHKKVSVSFLLLVNEALNFLRVLIPTTIEIEVNVDPLCGNIHADPTQINQVLMNLCTNAAHAMEQDGGILRIEVKAIKLDESDVAKNSSLKPGAYIVLSVADTGIGISEEHLDRIFDPYFTTKEVDKGSGMGLAVVQGIIQSHDGFLTVKSTPGRGSLVKLYFPKIEFEAETQASINGSTQLPRGVERILVVDDEESIAKLTQKRLEILGYKALSKTNSVEVLKLFREKPNEYDLIITDQTMPSMTGEQLAKELIKIRPDIPIIMCTGYSSRIDADKANSVGISAFIMKPVDKEELAQAVRKVLDFS